MPRETYWFFRRIAEMMGEGLVVLDEAGTLTFMNAEAERLLGWREAELLGKEVHDTIHNRKADGSPLPLHECPIHKAIVAGDTCRAAHDLFVRKDGAAIPVSYIATPLLRDGWVAGSVTVFRDITLALEQQEALRREKEKAENATRLKNRFVALAAHDLKNPLASLLLYLNQMKKTDPLAGKAAGNLRRMLDMIDALLDIDRLETGEIVPRLTDIPLHPLVDEAIGNFQFMADHKGVTLANRIDQNAVVRADPDLLKAVVQNLLSNAVKFSGGGDFVSVFMPDDRRIAVQDTGIGIIPCILPKLFVQGENRSRKGTANEPGTGLGLPLSQEIMKAHGGGITVQSDAGKGSTFFIHLPSPAPADPS